MRKLVICALSLAMVGCKSEYDSREVNTITDEEQRIVHTVDGDRVTGVITSKGADGEIKEQKQVADGFLHGDSFVNRNGKLFVMAKYVDGRQVSFEQFCETGKHEIKREMVSWPTSYSEDTFSCATGVHLTKKNLVDTKPVGEQMVAHDVEGQQVFESKLNFNNKGEHHGENIWFAKNGKPQKIANYTDGVLDGLYMEYDYKSELAKKGTYKEGKIVGLWEDENVLSIAGEESVNPDSVKKQVLLALGIDPDSVSVYMNRWPSKTTADLGRAQFYMDKGMVDFAKPFSVNGALENLISSRMNQPLYRFVPATNMVSEDVLDWVLERGGNVNATDYSGRNRLMMCLGFGECSTGHVAKLIKMTNIETTDSQGRSALHLVCQRPLQDQSVRSEQRSQILGIGDVNLQDEYGWTPLHYCLSNGYIDEARKLVAHGADISIKNNKGVSASDMVWLKTDPASGSHYEAQWNEKRVLFASELHKAGKLSFHTKLPAFEKSIRDLAMSNGDIELVQRIDMVEPM